MHVLNFSFVARNENRWLVEKTRLNLPRQTWNSSFQDKKFLQKVLEKKLERFLLMIICKIIFLCLKTNKMFSKLIQPNFTSFRRLLVCLENYVVLLHEFVSQKHTFLIFICLTIISIFKWGSFLRNLFYVFRDKGESHNFDKVDKCVHLKNFTFF